DELNKSGSLSLEALPEGIYLLKITDNAGTNCFKVIKQ
ncbi:MAG: T9SS type A sorting domain-containing protein, partial [Flavobacteriia bacterium]|nr:T9SS type A sorting domain-containing protein [Flavobacteriia bacterium]